MAALVGTKRNSVIPAFYARLVAAGEPKELALMPCRRKLLTIRDATAKHHTRCEEVARAAATWRARPLLTQDGQVLRGRAAPIVGGWSVPSAPFQTRGGGTPYCSTSVSAFCLQPPP